MRVPPRQVSTAPAAVSPPIKWPGGKAKEYPFIEHLIPKFDRYIEPFFGGGAIYFILQPKQAVINDFSGDLMDFYRFLKGEYATQDFADALNEYVHNWEKIPAFITLFEGDLVTIYEEIRAGAITPEELKARVKNTIRSQEQNFNGLFSVGFCIDRANLEAQIVKNLVSKLTRTAVIEKRHHVFSRAEIDKNVETAFRSGFYMHFRDLMNNKIGKGEVSAAKYTANYYFIREFCYGAMFRYNAAGDFNIPYGGIAYNSKDFRKKVSTILSAEFRDIFTGTQIENGDFADVLNKHEASAGDFIFLDPPYDSDFSSYDNNGFGIEDHQRLADFIHKTKAQCMLLIKETPFIRSLYDGKPGIKIESFDKRYLYNVKGRNNQDANHLIIYNYSI
jgi:DNA adenine methylase